MRPRPDAAENRSARRTPRKARRCSFNEAAARCRGKPLVDTFNALTFRGPSMRPRPDAAENPLLACQNTPSSIDLQ